MPAFLSLAALMPEEEESLLRLQNPGQKLIPVHDFYCTMMQHTCPGTHDASWRKSSIHVGLQSQLPRCYRWTWWGLADSEQTHLLMHDHMRNFCMQKCHGLSSPHQTFRHVGSSTGWTSTAYVLTERS